MRLGGKGSVYVAVGLTTFGFLMIFLGWNGAAGKDFVAGQVPYVISGGLAGLGVVLVGLAVALVEVRRRETARIEGKLDALLEHFGAGKPEEKAEEKAEDKAESAEGTPTRARPSARSKGS